MFAHGETATRLRAAAVTDPYSGEVDDRDWSTPDELAIPGCGFDPGGTTELIEVGRAAVLTQPTLFAPADADIGPADRIEIRSRTWEVDGDPALWRSPFTGWEPGLVVKLRLFEG